MFMFMLTGRRPPIPPNMQASSSAKWRLVPPFVPVLVCRFCRRNCCAIVCRWFPCRFPMLLLLLLLRIHRNRNHHACSAWNGLRRPGTNVCWYRDRDRHCNRELMSSSHRLRNNRTGTESDSTTKSSSSGTPPRRIHSSSSSDDNDTDNGQTEVASKAANGNDSDGDGEFQPLNRVAAVSVAAAAQTVGLLSILLSSSSLRHRKQPFSVVVAMVVGLVAVVAPENPWSM
mmetsp:Transcript_11145/g.23545  ORF Transcript_11145/g.23545 Transcript_11145/m.23545 type:complete len:229 (+) Transcript_11145:847-1533(+)